MFFFALSKWIRFDLMRSNAMRCDAQAFLLSTIKANISLIAVAVQHQHTQIARVAQSTVLWVFALSAFAAIHCRCLDHLQTRSTTFLCGIASVRELCATSTCMFAYRLGKYS